MPSNRRVLTLLFVGLAGAALLLRLLPHQPNVAALGAVSILAGYYLTGPRRWLIPLGALLISDAALGFYHWPIMAAVYGSYGLIIALGSGSRRLTHRAGPAGRVGALALATPLGSLSFYLITNAAVALWSPLYPHTVAGLLTSYVNGLPFFRNSLASDLGYTIVLALVIETTVVLLATAKRQLASRTVLTHQQKIGPRP